MKIIIIKNTAMTINKNNYNTCRMHLIKFKNSKLIMKKLYSKNLIN